MKRKLSPAKRGSIYSNYVTFTMKETHMNIQLEINEVNFILQVLGELPTKSGAFVLLKNIEEQAIAQSPSANTETTQQATA